MKLIINQIPYRMKIYKEFNLANWPKMVKHTEINLSKLSLKDIYKSNNKAEVKSSWRLYAGVYYFCFIPFSWRSLLHIGMLKERPILFGNFFSYFGPKLCRLLVFVSFHRQFYAWKAGHLDQVIVLVLPYNIHLYIHCS